MNYKGSEYEAGMAPQRPRRSSQLKIDIEGLPDGNSHVNVMCFDLGKCLIDYLIYIRLL